MMATAPGKRHATKAPPRRRKYDRDRLYDTARWKRFREWYLAQISHRCEAMDCDAWATEVHHVHRLRHNAETALDPSHVEGLCKSCHSRKTAKEVGLGR